MTGGFVYDGDPASAPRPDTDILLRDGRIHSIGPAATREARRLRQQRLTTDHTEIDAAGMLVLPGFVNAHWHDMFAMRVAFKGALRPAADQDDTAAFMAAGGDMYAIAAAFDKLGAAARALTPDEAVRIARYSIATQLLCGSTTLGDVGSVNLPPALAQAALELGVRCSVSTWAADGLIVPDSGAYQQTRDPAEIIEELRHLEELTSAHPEHLRMRPTAAYGTNMSDSLGAALADLCRESALPFATHVGALRHEAEVVRRHFGTTPVRRLHRLGLTGSGLMAVHTGFVDDGETGILLETGAHVSHSPAKYGATGEDTITGTGAMTEFLRRGIPVSLSTDGAPTPVGGMVESMSAAWRMHNEYTADPTTVLPSRALAMATSTAAAGLGWSDVGTLAPGHAADLVLVPRTDWRFTLSSRPLEALLQLGGSRDVHTVVAGGRVVVRDHALVGADLRQLEADYLDALRSFSARVLHVPADALASVLGATRNREVLT
ncbi:amidohydrolase family protein [Myceligenerans cantabricum]